MPTLRGRKKSLAENVENFGSRKRKALGSSHLMAPSSGEVESGSLYKGDDGECDRPWGEWQGFGMPVIGISHLI